MVFSETFKVGDLVVLNEDEDFVEEQSLKLLKDGSSYKKEIARTMLGKTYTIVPTESTHHFDENWVRLISDDGKKCHFPKTTLRKVECSK